jgi:tetratricopeptide (TPR) repeat protein/transcriptional regulator with XRE-family HTH domain
MAGGGQGCVLLGQDRIRLAPGSRGGRSRGDAGAVAEPGLGFAGLLRQLRDEAGLTQEELAEAARLSPRSVSDLERGIHATAHKDTAVLLAGALGLAGPAREQFVAAARGRNPAGAFAAAATRGLPRDIAAFTGRQAELARLMGTLNAMAAGGGVVGICAIDGMAGIGKTTFAVHAAHRLAGMFPDGQFFLPLHAHTAGQRPVEPADALASLLLTARVPAAQIPPGVDARAGRWRDQVAGKKILLVLDDAAGYEQVRPLLPGTAGSLVLVISRRRLTALEDATVISLDTLPPGEAAALLARLAARAGIHAGDAAVREITRLCGYLPLAIGMIASQLHHHPAWTAADLAAELAAAEDRLAFMQAETLSVAAAFDLSYADLTAGQQRLFRRLGVHSGSDIDAYAAAALDGTDLAAARRHLDGLYDHYLLTEPARGRYRLHDLLREHARALADHGDPADAGAAAGRLLDYYAHTAAAAGRHIETGITATARPLPGEPPAVAPPLSTAGQASAWLDAERANLHAAVGYAAARGRPGHAIAIPAAISGFLFARGHWDQSAALHRAALATARLVGDRAGQAGALHKLGLLQEVTGDYPAAAASHQQALALYRDLGDRLGQASALNQRGVVQWLTGDYPAAAASHQQAIALYRDLGHRVGQAMAISDLGEVQRLTGDYPAAAASQQQALDLFCALGHRMGQANALLSLGEVQRLAGDYPAAAANQQQALDLFCDLGHRMGQANATGNLGMVQLRTGDYPAAAASLTAALGMFRDIGYRGGQAEVLNYLGEVLARSGESRQARDHYAQALAIAREISAPVEEARALEGLGHCLLHDGNPGQAATHLQQALTIYRRIGDPRGTAGPANLPQQQADIHQPTAPASRPHRGKAASRARPTTGGR